MIPAPYDTATPDLDLPALQRLGNFIDGALDRAAPETFQAINPATLEVLAELPRSDRETAVRAIAAATGAQPDWAAMTAWDRAAICNRLADEIDAARRHLARILSLDQCKPLAQAEGEVAKSAEGFHMAAEQGKYLGGETIHTQTPGRMAMTRRHPRGVHAVITPWNFPVNIPVEYLGPALVTGNTVVWVPAPTTALIAVAFMRVLEAAGLPAGVINLVLGDGATVGDEIVVNPGTHAIGFTGSPPTGRRIAERGAGKPMLLELDGNGPMIVRADADLDAAAEAAAGGAFPNAGQICAAMGRVLADRSVADAVAERIAAQAQAQFLGNPLEQGTTMGPMNNADVLGKVTVHVDAAVASGARCLAGGKARPDLGGHDYEPTVLADVTPQMDVAGEETFGPVVPVIACDGDDQLMAVARDTRHGLAMSVYSADTGRAMAMAAALPSGIVNINAPTTWWELHLPFGGVSGTQSGLGPIGGRQTLEAMTEIRLISISDTAWQAAR